ncbi:MAG: alpha/beta hydrolase [Acidobacteriota bacterium]
MSDHDDRATTDNPIRHAPLVIDLPNADLVRVRREIPYREDPEDRFAVFDLYAPSETADRPLPLVLVVSGYPDAGFERIVGCRLKDVRSYDAWGRLLAAAGCAVVIASNRDPVADLTALLHHLRDDADSLGLDLDRTAIWACSGNVPNALALLIDPPWPIRCAALLYGFLLDLADDPGGATPVADAAAQFRFAMPAVGRTVDDLPATTALLIVRAGSDEMPGLNASIDTFLDAAGRLDRPVTTIDLPDAPHAFDLFHDHEASRQAILRIVDFLRVQLDA